MLYISQLILNPCSRQVQSEVCNPYEMHRTLMRAFPTAAQGGPGRVLFRLGNQAASDQAELKVLVQSDQEPDWGWLAESSHYLLPGFHPNPASKAFEPVFQSGQRLYFRLRANPTVKRRFPGQDKSKRIGLYKEAEQRGWLARKAGQGGFTPLEVALTAEGNVGGKIHRSTQESYNLNLLAVRFDGQLQVIAPAKFLETLGQGIGSGKGLGFGLLSLAWA